MIELTIERLAPSGEGVGTHHGRAIFVAGALPGERVRVRLEPSRQLVRGTVVERLADSPARRAPPCALADRCGGCDWLHADEALQLAEKQAMVAAALERLGGVDLGAVLVKPARRSPRPLGMRRRAVMHVVDGALGFFERKSHAGVVVDVCPALTPGLATLAPRLSAALGTAVKDVEEVHLLECEGKVAVSLHLKGAMKPKHQALAAAVVREGVVDGVVVVPEAPGAPPFLSGDVVLEVDGVLHRPDAFAQANEALNRELVAEAVERLELTGAEEVLELFSGNGNFTLPLAPRARRVVAVESGSVAVELARRGLARAGRSNVRLIQGDAARMVEGLLRDGARFDRLLLDPPRDGAPEVARWASALLVDRVVYVSCEPGTLARDVRSLAGAGYRPLTVQVFDLFPQTRHVETVVSLCRDA